MRATTSCKCCCRCCFKSRPRCWSTCCTISLLLTILFSLAVGLGLADKILFLIMKKELQLVPDSATIDDWVKPDIPLYETYYIFDTQNPDGFAEGEVPVVNEVGPFVYRKYDNKFNVTWNSDETLVTFNRDVYFVFDPDKSIGDPHNYNITVINVPLLAVLNQLEHTKNILFQILGSTIAQVYLIFLRDQQLFIEKNAHQLLWGYHDPIFGMMNFLGLIDSPLFSIKVNRSSNFTEGFSTVDTGKNDIYDVAQLERWNNLTNLSVWNSEEARHLHGTLAFRFRPLLEKGHKLTVFIDEFIRHGQIVYGGDTQLHGIDLYRYKIADHVFCNSSQCPSNEGYYAYNYSYGVMNVSIIYPFATPLYASKPHCLDCNPEYFITVSGYHPLRSKHDTFLDIEPFTGIVMNAAKRLQINVRIEKGRYIRQLAKVQDVTMYPWFYLNIEGQLTESKADDFKLQIQLPRIALKVIMILSLVISGIVTIWMGALISRWYHLKKKAKLRFTKADNSSINSSNAPLLKNSGDYTDYQSIKQSTV